MALNSINLLTLGCSKNLADSQRLLRKLASRGIMNTADPADAELILVNTCGFIDDAKTESIDEILALAGMKEHGKKLLVMGCLSERYRDELMREIPEIDAIFGVSDEDAIVEYCDKALNVSAGQGRIDTGGTSGFLAAPGALSAPVKVAEGCSRGCTFCAIPLIRGPYRSGHPDEILREAASYVAAGIKELLVVAQDTTSYGRELQEYGLARLLREMARIDGEFWIRPLYFYPAGVTDELLEAIRDEEKICSYIDLPLQHASDRILTSMGRRGDSQQYLDLIDRIRKSIPDITLRTTFIVGFPGETDRDFDDLMDFVEKVRFNRLGAFKYSNEEGTRAYGLEGQVSDELKEERLEALMNLQSGISLELNQSLVGRRVRALVETVDEGVSIGRTQAQAPEVDGITVLNCPDAVPGTFVDVKIKEAHDYDLDAECL